MHQAVQIRIEGPRGCGYRWKKGALYVTASKLGVPCGKLPVPVKRCPCCGEGISFSRAWRWLDEPWRWWENIKCDLPDEQECRGVCPLRDGHKMNGAYLLWIGEQHYPTPEAWVEEAMRMGVSRRIAGDQIPRNLVVGETYILVAHSKAIANIPEKLQVGDKVEYTPGIFHVFIPQAIEVLVDDTTTDEEVEGYLKRGLTPVLVRHVKAQNGELKLEDGEL